LKRYPDDVECRTNLAAQACQFKEYVAAAQEFPGIGGNLRLTILYFDCETNFDARSDATA